MSHDVALADLAATAAPHGSTPFLLYASADGSARVNHVVSEVTSDGDTAVVRCRGFGRGVAAAVERRAPLALLWPAPQQGEFSLIADGVGTLEGEMLRIDIEAAVLHRPAPVDGETAC